jgi:hypothetical protein
MVAKIRLKIMVSSNFHDGNMEVTMQVWKKQEGLFINLVWQHPKCITVSVTAGQWVEAYHHALELLQLLWRVHVGQQRWKHLAETCSNRETSSMLHVHQKSSKWPAASGCDPESCEHSETVRNRGTALRS